MSLRYCVFAWSNQLGIFMLLHESDNRKKAELCAQLNTDNGYDSYVVGW
jgi:hypothetical protein